MTAQKKLFVISELFNDDLSKVATACIMCGAKESHSYIMEHRLYTSNLDKLTPQINLIYQLISDHYNIDGVIAFVEAVHAITPHVCDNTFDEDKQEHGLLFYVD